MTVDISKVFKANVKAIRISLPESPSKSQLLNEELLGKSKTKSNKSNEAQTISIAKESRQIVNI